MPRYQTSGIPPVMAQLGLSAFMPHFNRLAASGAQAYKGRVTGQPGTRAIPIGDPRVPAPGSNDIVQMGGARSSDAPNAFWPNLYYAQPDNYWPGAGQPVQVYDPVRPQDTTMLPVPATDLRSVYQARSAKLAGGVDNQRQRALKQAANFIRWPMRRTGNGSDQ